MSTAFNEFQLSAAAYPNGRIAVLLARYPHLIEEEREELFRFTQRASREEMRNLRNIPALRDKLDRLMRDHPDHFRPASESSFWIVTAVVIGLFVFWML